MLRPVDTPRDLEEVVRRERLLHDPDVRSSEARLRELLHPDFLEHGASGRVWDVESTVGALTADPTMAPGESTSFSATPLADDVVLLTYRITGARSTLRGSVWVRTPGAGWQLRFHQGTLS